MMFMDSSEPFSMKVTGLGVLLFLFVLLAGCVKHSETLSPNPVPASKSGAVSIIPPSEEPAESDDPEPVVSNEEVTGSNVNRVVNEPVHEGQRTSESTNEEPAISLDELIERLKNTEAIGLFTKLAIRSDVLDFKSSIDDYRKKGELERYVGHLRDHFDGLVLKILALLERDPVLSKDIHHARESIWKSFLEAKS
jgi:hypothetical protein